MSKLGKHGVVTDRKMDVNKGD